jgi:molybdopterin converting factor small subunit
MSITVQLTYDMSVALGVARFEIEGAANVAEAVAQVRQRFGEDSEKFAQLTRVAALAVNGVLVNHQRGMRTKVSDGDVIAFVKAAAGG